MKKLYVGFSSCKLLELNGKIAALDVAGEFCMTFFHHVEEIENAPNPGIINYLKESILIETV